MKRERIIKEAENELSANGYATVSAYNMHTCADVFAQKKGKKLVIKVVYNIDSVSKKEALALYKLSGFLDAEPIILGAVSRNGRLKNEVVYDRFSVKCMSPETLMHMSSEVPGYLASKAVGIKVRVDGVRLKGLRQLSDLTVTALAKQAGLSKNTLYKHEKTDDYASIGTVARLERVLHDSIRAGGRSESRRKALGTSKLAKTGISAITLDNSPFDIVAKSRNYYEISLHANIRTLIKRAELFKLLKERFENNYPFFINDSNREIEGIPVIKKKDLMKISSEEELLNAVY